VPPALAEGQPADQGRGVVPFLALPLPFPRVRQLPASPGAFVWRRLYQAEFQGQLPAGRDDPLWCTPRRPGGPMDVRAGPSGSTLPVSRSMPPRADYGSRY